MVGDGCGPSVVGYGGSAAAAMSRLLGASTSHRHGGTVRRESRTQRQQRDDERHLQHRADRLRGGVRRREALQVRCTSGTTSAWTRSAGSGWRSRRLSARPTRRHGAGLGGNAAGADAQGGEPSRRRPTTRSVSNAIVGGGALAAVVGFGVALLTHFTTASTTILVSLLCGALVSSAYRPAARGQRRDTGVSRLPGSALAAAVGAVLLVATAAEWSMERAISAVERGDSQTADAAFQMSERLRPWDADVALLAATALSTTIDDRTVASGTGTALTRRP